MRIALAPVGGHGDVLPLLALGSTLHARGHSVLVCAPEIYRSRIMKLGFQMVSIGSGFQDLLEGHTDVKNREEVLLRAVSTEVPVQFVSLRDSLREADVLIGSMLQIAGPSMCEQLGLPYFYVATTPVLLDKSQYPSIGVSAGGVFKSISRARLANHWEQVLGEAINRERKLCGQPPVTDLFQHLFCSGYQVIAVDPDMAPVPANSKRTVTGFLFHDSSEPLGTEWHEYFTAGPPPIYLAPVRIRRHAGIELIKMVAEVVPRLLVGWGWSGIDPKQLPANSSFLDSDAFSLIFPNVALVVHQGGTELTAAAARAGVPQVIVPHLVDQNYWADRVEALKLGPPAARSELADTVRKTMGDASLRASAQKYGETIRSRDGLTTAAETIEKNVQPKI